MSPTVVTSSKKLSGGALGYLKDLLLLNTKTTQEMTRGIAESYLDVDGAAELAAKLGVEPPRTKKRFYRYFTDTRVYSVTVDAYDEAQADAEAARMQEVNISQGDIHFGTRSRFNTDGGRIQRVLSTVTAERPKAADVPNIHPWEVERIEAEARGQTPPQRAPNWESLIV